MKMIADLYVRVSTDEQADRGYSQRNQEEVLRKYCEINSIEVRDVIYEDHSAKTFNRPKWNKLLQNLKKHKNKIDLVLFTKWDRFSRNAGDAYQMINILRKLGVEPQGIEQPLDLTIPENKMMLAFYLAAPEVENDRRALNTFHGMRRARKEGRYMGYAPVGYVNKVKEDGTKYIAFDQPEASILKWAFEELSKGIFNTEQVLCMAKEKGLKASKNNFWRAIRNPLYCGKIVIPKYKDEDLTYVTGQHEPLISQILFYKVQDILDGRSKTYLPKAITTKPFPLRGFFTCPECSKILTASISKGRHKYYPYYHCSAGCKYRINSDTANEVFIKNLKQYVPIPEIKNLYISVLSECYREQTKEIYEEKFKIIAQLKDYEKRLSHARDLLATQQIDASDYRDMKSDYGAVINRLEIKLAGINIEDQDIDEILKVGVENLLKLNEYYDSGDWSQSRDLIGSIYPENFTISENQFRTTRVNEVLQVIYLINSRISTNKKGTKKTFSSLSHVVAGTGLEPVSAAADMSASSYKFKMIFLMNSLPIPVFKYFSLFIASDLELKNSI
ncbi:recombinase family protein [Flavobacterium plurextorum]|uniref:Recombinase family protein n=1 Tax=Flavobacterium plurextorum TaxID=1114867 RepID=A0ABX4CQ42_9FLAO|nr:recombinase family protein [Flavobacterium plurextorum]OXB03817.1 recombinase family protein [Flavobacterium plurextorum]